MKKTQKGLSPILAVIIVGIVVIAAVVFFSTQKGGLPTPTGIQKTSQNIPTIQDTSGLNTVASELDNTDLNAVDKELNQLDSDTSTF